MEIQIDLKKINYEKERITMSKLTEMYAGLTAEDKDRLGKVSSRIRVGGCHLVEIVEACEIDESRIRIDFKTDSGETAEWTGWLEQDEKDAAGQKTGNKVPNTRTMNTLTFICNAAGVKLQAVLSRTVAGTKEYRSGTVPTVSFPTLEKKKLYITTSTVIEGDKKDDSKVYVKQAVDAFKFFDVKKRNAIEITANVVEGTTMEATAHEAKDTIEVDYRFTDNDACQRKLSALTEQSAGAGSNVGQIAQPGQSSAPAENADDI